MVIVVLPNSSGTLLLDDGSGAPLTNLNADNLSSGTNSGTDARFPAVLPAVDGSALTNLVAGIGIGTASGSVGFGITVLNLEGPGVSTAFLDQTTGIGTVFFEGGGGGGSISVSHLPLTQHLVIFGIVQIMLEHSFIMMKVLLDMVLTHIGSMLLHSIYHQGLVFLESVQQEPLHLIT